MVFVRLHYSTSFWSIGYHNLTLSANVKIVNMLGHQKVGVKKVFLIGLFLLFFLSLCHLLVCSGFVDIWLSYCVKYIINIFFVDRQILVLFFSCLEGKFGIHFIHVLKCSLTANQTTVLFGKKMSSLYNIKLMLPHAWNDKTKKKQFLTTQILISSTEKNNLSFNHSDNVIDCFLEWSWTLVSLRI